mmetsp:Transcript_46292/g.110158  ORF Transcript_46292/g.110158 Transcript_46292/m.110158 type:complete len:986 (-) Transcript_46292:161-3118(-)
MAASMSGFPTGAARQELIDRVKELLPNLLALCIDQFPLAAGLDPPQALAPRRLVLQAVCCVPAAQRLDEEVNAVVRALAEGVRRPAVQTRARMHDFSTKDDSGSDLQVVVNWLDCTDFRAGLLKGSPGCVEVFAPEESQALLVSSPDWQSLCSNVIEEIGPLGALRKKRGYVGACTGPLQGLLFRAEKASRDFTEQEIAVVAGLARRVAEGCSPGLVPSVQSLVDTKEARTATWTALIHELRGIAKDAEDVEPRLGEITVAWCEELRFKEYCQFVKTMQSEPVRARPPLQAWLKRLRATAGAGSPEPADLFRGKSSPPRILEPLHPEQDGGEDQQKSIVEMGKSASAREPVNTKEERLASRESSYAGEEHEDTTSERTSVTGGVAEVSTRRSLELEEDGSPSHRPRTEEDLPMEHEVKEMLEGLLPRNSEVVLMQQVGSFMYDLQIESSDKDFRVLYLVPPEGLLGLQAPKRQFSRHVDKGFGADKRGEIEYSGEELGDFVAELARGNPRNVELLFSKKAAWRGWAWQELRTARRCFLTLRCVAQYLGFVTERLKKLKAIIDDPDKFGEGKAAEASKLLYHAHHKLLEAQRILALQEPTVQLKGAEREKVMHLRMQRVGSVQELPDLYAEADTLRRSLLGDMDAATTEKRLPTEVDAQALIAWLRSIRRRCALQLACGMPGAEALQPVDLRRTRTADDRAAICDLLAEVEEMEGVQIVYAGYELSSRTMGTANSASDHDIRCIFVHPRSAYFGLQPVSHAFKHEFPAGACSAPVEISGWEARHALQMLAKNSIAVLGALQSPMAFRGPKWQRRLLEEATAHFDRRKVMAAWYCHAQQNFDEYIQRHEEPIRKKYVHVLRPLLSITWLRHRGPSERSWPPVELVELLAHTSRWLSEEEHAAVAALVGSPEALSAAAPRVPALDTFIQRLLAEEAPPNFKSQEWAPATPPPSSLWHDLCVELITEATADVGYQSESPQSKPVLHVPA